MSTTLFRKYIDMINEAQEELTQSNEVVPQNKIAAAWTQNKGSARLYRKLLPVALLTAKDIPEEYKQLAKSEAGKRDQTSYSEERFNNGLLIFQAPKAGRGEIYITDMSNKTNYIPWPSEITRPLLDYLSQFGIDGNSIRLYWKKDPTPMIPASTFGIEGKRVQTSWGDQAVDVGAFLTQEANGHTYVINPDEKGLPIGYALIK